MLGALVITLIILGWAGIIVGYTGLVNGTRSWKTLVPYFTGSILYIAGLAIIVVTVFF